MIDFKNVEKNNMKMLGVIVRYNRVNKGYSLRGLAKITNISHTLISNFEKGKVVPHHETIKDIFSNLDLVFYDSPDISPKFTDYYNRIYRHLLFYEYVQAKILIDEIELEREIYENSIEIINFAIIRCLYYTITDIHADDKDKLIEQYEIVLDFFSPTQKQLFYFIKGLDYLNKEYYKDSRQYFEKALKIGDKSLNLLINEHYIVTLSKSNKLVDAWRIATESIKKFESQTNYIRAMRLRTRIAHDYIRMVKYDDAKEIYNRVLKYATEYKVYDLVNRCNTYLGKIALFEGNMKLCEEYIKKVKPPFSNLYHYLVFDIASSKKDEKLFMELYQKTMTHEWVKKSPKTRRFFEMILMRFDEKYMDKEKYIMNAKEQINLGFETDDALLIETASEMLSDYYKKERKYKNAFEVNERVLHYHKYGIK